MSEPHPRTVGGVLVETVVAFGITHVFGMVGHSNLGFVEAIRLAEERGQINCIGIRHVLAGRPVIIAGRGAYSGRSALVALAERLGAPVSCTTSSAVRASTT